MLPSHKELRDDVLRVRVILDDVAQGGNRRSPESQSDYHRLRDKLLGSPITYAKVPQVLRLCRTLDEFWRHIKQVSPQWAPRIQHLASEFAPLLASLEASIVSPADLAIGDQLKTIGSDVVHGAWMKALERKSSDASGAITAARTLVESVLKHILDDLEVPYGSSDDLPKLNRTVATTLNLAPDQHGEQEFKQVLQGCASVVQGLGAIRSRLGDSHGAGKSSPRPSERHAELAVGLAGTMAIFLLKTHEERKAKSSRPRKAEVQEFSPERVE